MAKPRNLLYVGGLENEVTEDILFAAFVPFGPLRSVQIPKDFKESKTCFEK
jgi:peptidyl-prolyl isomerase E (cyclophilin E)